MQGGEKLLPSNLVYPCDLTPYKLAFYKWLVFYAHRISISWLDRAYVSLFLYPCWCYTSIPHCSIIRLPDKLQRCHLTIALPWVSFSPLVMQAVHLVDPLWVDDAICV
eukprot:TRINITY_DN72916_c0_g1_i1.p1 TRINITY_DN72916_c0_g1~~TRINITY_DN72916_c0_g1_i1.p1  ORF type:complete len:108 (+),score=4.02 TRINITY_DN72916_c0_g1_i1:230-553(+)